MRLFPTSLILGLWVVCLPARADNAAPPPLSLGDAVGLALTHNRSLLNAQSDVDDAGLELAARQEDFDPRAGLRAQAGRDRLTERFEGGLEIRQRFATGGDARVFGGVATTSDNEETFLRVNVRQPLFRRAGSLVTREPVVAAGRALTDARRAYYERKQDLVLEVITAHEAVLRAARQMEVDARTVERLTALTELTRAREDIGQASRVDSLRIELQLGEALTRLDNSRDVLAQVTEEFAVLLGLDPLQHFRLLPPPLLDLDPPNLDEATALALRNRMDVARALDALDDASRQIRITRRDLLPDVGLLGDLELAGDAPGLERDTWFVGVVVEPDFSPGDRLARVAGAETRRDRAERRLIDLHYAIQLDVRRQTRGYTRGLANLRIAERNRDLASKRLELAEALFRMGRGDAFTVSEAEDAHALAVNTELAARTEASLSAHRLLRALGQLIETPDELKASAE